MLFPSVLHVTPLCHIKRWPLPAFNCVILKVSNGFKKSFVYFSGLSNHASQQWGDKRISLNYFLGISAFCSFIRNPCSAWIEWILVSMLSLSLFLLSFTLTGPSGSTQAPLLPENCINGGLIYQPQKKIPRRRMSSQL